MSEVVWRDASDFPNINAQKSYLLDKNQPPRPRTHRTGAHNSITLSTSPLSPPAASQRAHPAHAHSRHISKRCPPFSLAPRSPTTEGSHLRHTQHTEAKTLTILVRCTTRTQTDSHARSPAHLTASTYTHALFWPPTEEGAAWICSVVCCYVAGTGLPSPRHCSKKARVNIGERNIRRGVR